MALDFVTVTDIMDRVHELRVGDEIRVPNVRGRGGHGAYITIEKLNKKSVKGTERKGSYTPGTQWTVHLGSCFSIEKRIDGIWKCYWINDY